MFNAMQVLPVLAVILFSQSACQAAGEQHADARTKLTASQVNEDTYANETKDWGLAPTIQVRTGTFHGQTPITVPGAKTITTPQLHKMLVSKNPPVVIDALRGNSHKTIPGAVWLSDIGSDDRHGDLANRLSAKLADLTNGKIDDPIVFFCESAQCWLSYNASLRAMQAGYSNVQWYRGGIKSWKAAGLPTAISEKVKW